MPLVHEGIMPNASDRVAMVEAVPISLQVPYEHEMHCSSSRKSASGSLAARKSSQAFHRSVAALTSCPRQKPTALGPADNWMAGMSQLAAAINCAGVVLSQPDNRINPSIGFPRTVSSMSIAA